VRARIFSIFASVLALLSGVVLLGPFLISTEPMAGLTTASSAATDESHFVRVPFPGTDGLEIHYVTRGDLARDDAPAFVLVHGFTFSASTWDQVLDRFGAEGRVYAYDQVPYGLSAKPTAGDWRGPNPYSKEAAIAQLFSFMDAVGIEHATLVGNSSGGTLAAEAALARPERVDRLILVAPWVYARRPTIPAWLAAFPQMRRLSLLIARKLGQGVLLEYSYADPQRIDAARRSRATAHTQVQGWDIAWGELLNRSLSSPVELSRRLAELTQPVLLLTGDRDRLVPVADTRRVAEGLSNARLEVLPGCGHVPQEECSDAFWRAVSDWLTAGSGKARPAPTRLSGTH
jgi:pimeloyl-ACP methyl ester carboxylesterase